jgi:DNA-directed RNA polymerase subunit RPC12/RpoP
MEPSSKSNDPSDIRCPVCGSLAEPGYIHGAESYFFWSIGKPTWKNIFKVAVGLGEAIGHWGLGAGVYLEGIRCRYCNHIILHLKEKS